jgi:putative addiction module component (TIGR02574 family)
MQAEPFDAVCDIIGTCTRCKMCGLDGTRGHLSWDRDMSADSIFNLSPPEKLQLVEDLWDDLAAVPSDIPVHAWQKEELARRRANLSQNPEAVVSWQQVKARIRGQYSR